MQSGVANFVNLCAFESLWQNESFLPQRHQVTKVHKGRSVTLVFVLTGLKFGL